MKQLLLVNPPDTRMLEANLPAFVDQERGYLPPLGLLQVASYARAKTDWNVVVYDSNISGDSLAPVVCAYKPDVVGITTTTFTLISALEAAREVKKWSSYSKVALGGVHPSIYPEETVKLPNVDYVVTGEGEKPLVELLESIGEGNNSQRIFGNSELLSSEELDQLPYPDRRDTDYRKYHSLLGTGKTITTMITSRGCPYRCIFCHRPHLGKRFRARSVESVLGEFGEIARLGIGEVLIYDDTFSLDMERAKEICLGLIHSQFGIVFDIRTRVDRVDDELMELLRGAGCKRIHYGIEASSDRVLREMQKGIRLADAERAIKLSKRYGIETLAYFIFGTPTETVEEMERTIEYAKGLGVDYCHFAVMTPYPATPLYELGLRQGRFGDYWREFARQPRGDFTTPYWAEVEGLDKMLKRAYRSFYLRPSYILRELRKARKNGSLGRKIRAGIRVITR